MTTKKTCVISAYSCTGKTYFTNHSNDKSLKIFDLTPDDFIWIKRIRNEQEMQTAKEIWEKTPKLLSWEGRKLQIKNELITVKNPDFAKDYANKIKEIIKSSNYDIIFISTHIEIRELLTKENIPFVTIYPANTESVKNEWLGRFCQKLMTENKEIKKTTIETFKNELDKNLPTIEAEPNGKLYKLSNNGYITKELLNTIITNQK